MKNLLTTALLITAIAGSTIAQERRAERPERSPEEIATLRTQRLTEQLNLTAEQREAVYGLQLEEATQQRELIAERRNSAAEARQARGEAMKQQRERQAALQQKLDEILTEEQRTKLAEQRVERREAAQRLRERRAGDRGRSNRGERSKLRGERPNAQPAEGGEG